MSVTVFRALAPSCAKARQSFTGYPTAPWFPRRASLAAFRWACRQRSNTGTPSCPNTRPGQNMSDYNGLESHAPCVGFREPGYSALVTATSFDFVLMRFHANRGWSGVSQEHVGIPSRRTNDASGGSVRERAWNSNVGLRHDGDHEVARNLARASTAQAGCRMLGCVAGLHCELNCRTRRQLLTNQE